MYNDAAWTPPVNNLLQPDMYNRLDAGTIEKTRVLNTQLDQKLSVQQKIIAKYRMAAEKYHKQEKNRVKNELRKISSKLPAVSRVRDFRNKFLYGANYTTTGRDNNNNNNNNNSANGLPLDVTQSMPEVRTRKIRGVPLERPEMPFCERFFMHHLPTKKKFYMAPVPPLPPATARGEEGGEGAAATEVGEGGEGGVVATHPNAGAEEIPASSAAAKAAEVSVTLIDLNDSPAAAAVNTQPVASGKLPRVTSSTEQEAWVVDDGGRRTHSDLNDPELSDGFVEGLSSARGGENGSGGDDNDLPLSADKRARRHSVNGQRPSRLHVPRTSLQPIQQQNLRLALSSPHLFNG